MTGRKRTMHMAEKDGNAEADRLHWELQSAVDLWVMTMGRSELASGARQEACEAVFAKRREIREVLNGRK